MKNDENKPGRGRRIILSVIAIAIIVAMVTILIISSVMADEAIETHPAGSSEAALEEEKPAPEEPVGTKDQGPEESSWEEATEPRKEQGAPEEQEESKGENPEAGSAPESASPRKLERVNENSTLLHVRQRPLISPDYKALPDVKSEYAVVMDADANTIIAGKKASQRIFPASMTKVMTLVTAVDFLDDMDKVFSLTLEQSDDFYRQNASVAGYAPGEPAKARDMLYGLILPSGADCALGLADVTAGSMQGFAALMNLEAKKMGLKDTHFTNTSGLHDDNNYTTPLDMAVIFRYALDNELCKNVLGSPSYTTEKTNEHPEGIGLWSHTFAYMTDVDMGGFTVTGGKTGFTTEARACMVTSAEKDGHTYIVVTAFGLNSRDMCADHIAVYKAIAEGKL